MTAPTQTRATGNQANGPPAWPALTAVVFAITLAVSVVALASPALMQLFIRDLSQVRQGQWWRTVTPVLVQSSGWGQLVFNLLGLAVVGTVLEGRLGRTSWAFVYLVGGVGSIAVLSDWKPNATGGGSSDAIAALIGALAVLLVASGRADLWDGAAQVYSIFFVAYLTALDLGGVVPSIIAGNASIALLVTARRALSPATLTRACLVVVAVGGARMAVDHDGHGTGILAGIAIALLVLTRRWLLERSGTARPIWLLVGAVVGVWSVTILTWVAWVRLLGVDLFVQAGGGHAAVGWLSVTVAAVASCVAAWVALQWLRRRWPGASVRVWLGLCLGLAVVSLSGPLHMAAGTASRAGLLSLHLVCAATIAALLAPTARTPGSAAPRHRRRAAPVTVPPRSTLPTARQV